MLSGYSFRCKQLSVAGQNLLRMQQLKHERVKLPKCHTQQLKQRKRAHWKLNGIFPFFSWSLYPMDLYEFSCFWKYPDIPDIRVIIPLRQIPVKFLTFQSGYSRLDLWELRHGEVNNKHLYLGLYLSKVIFANQLRLIKRGLSPEAGPREGVSGSWCEEMGGRMWAPKRDVYAWDIFGWSIMTRVEKS